MRSLGEFLRDKGILKEPQAPSLERGEECKTLADSAATQKAIESWAKHNGVEKPHKVGERFGYPVKVLLTAPGTIPPCIVFTFKRIEIDLWEAPDPDDVSERRKFNKLVKAIRDAGGRAYVESVIYRGQAGKWRIRVYTPYY